MSIKVKQWKFDNGELFLSLMNPDCEKSFALHEAKRQADILRDFQGRVEDELSY